MKKSIILIVAAMLLGATFPSLPPASATHKGCVIRAEFKRVHKGMSKKRVHRIFGAKGYKYDWGTDDQGRRFQARLYPRCNKDSHYSEVVFRGDAMRARQKTWDKERT